MRKIILGLVLFLAASVLFALPRPPEYRGPVNDPAGVLNSEVVKRLEARAVAYRNQTGNEIGILIVPTLGDKSIEDYSYDIFNAWGIGRKGNDNGVLFLAAIKEKKARIEVGYGLEAKLTDLECGRLVGRNSPMARYFRAGDFAAGVEAVMDGIVQAIGGDYNPPPTKDDDGNEGKPLSVLISIIIMIIVIILPRRLFPKFRIGGPFSHGGGFGSGGGSVGGGFTFGGGSSGGGGASGGW